ncbi:prepilin-type N-terminal cleavage/methylation domain-containing protein [Streptococcus sanguinis]|jgi:conserved uncharacterized protein|uniref:Type II secretion system protein G n=1 Tax=Streptococcus sanguinis TaxID=1305 RepID=A0AB74DJM1_STRSA|nr:prepilin-type N-terminal cleavage/methylation domain-containing protein [Streptococcus sanguinis]MBZ2041504.1 prepilin-type N-terminal cleavage/methylation domain-containing protein [Streptococcus sanguinis]MCC3170417.1 prepilin-type N-terminal cleavage/methylation domain protein [Streptococcus sanguinis]RSI30504.1 Type II secretion system protein G precursor [Streptococcus sanguinis]RSI33378.1 Type II secretion system protein G precursor [Streptococcus sanguinis]
MLSRLQKFRQDLKKKGKGFTLVELIVVIIIIAIIAAVAIPSLTSFQDNARKTRIQSEHRELMSAVQSFVGSQENPEETKLESLNQLAPYISKNAKQESDLASALAKNDKNPAHKIDGGKLVSEFIPAGKTTSDANYKKWTYDWKSRTTANS